MKEYKDEERLKELYEKYNSQEDVAEVCGCTHGTISYWMDKFDIETTDTHSNVRERDFTPVEHKPNTECDFCGNEFWRKPSRINENENNFCDRECQANWMSENISGGNHHQYNRINVECNFCGDEKQVTPYHHKQVENHYCDTECQFNDIDVSGINNPSWDGGKETVSCENCGEEKEVYPYRLENNNMFFCDVHCRGEWATREFSGENHPLHEGYSQDYGDNWLEVRSKIRERDNGSCQVCGVSRSEIGKWPDAHHIIPIGLFDTPEESNTPDNLILLCDPCHGEIEEDNSIAEQQEMFLDATGGFV